jgi:hypothetical protein
MSRTVVLLYAVIFACLAVSACGKTESTKTPSSSGDTLAAGALRISAKCDNSSPEALLNSYIKFLAQHDQIYGREMLDRFKEGEKLVDVMAANMKPEFKVESVAVEPEGSAVGSTVKSYGNVQFRSRFTMRQEDGQWKFFNEERLVPGPMPEWEDARSWVVPVGLRLPEEPRVTADLGGAKAAVETYRQMAERLDYLRGKHFGALALDENEFLSKAWCKDVVAKMGAVFEGVKNNPSHVAKWTIGEVKEEGDRASASVHIEKIDSTDDVGVELTKVDGTWKIVNETSDNSIAPGDGLW